MSAPPADLLADLRRALLAADEAALRVCGAALGIPAQQAERFNAQALLVLQRAHARALAAPPVEVELALGVLASLYTPLPAPAEVG